MESRSWWKRSMDFRYKSGVCLRLFQPSAGSYCCFAYCCFFGQQLSAKIKLGYREYLTCFLVYWLFS